MDHAALEEQRSRFADVMRARTSDLDLLSLFMKLSESDKFHTNAKPYCFADLIRNTAARISDAEVPRLLRAIERYAVAWLVREAVPKAEADQGLRALVKRAFSVAPMEAQPLMEVFHWSVRVGVASDHLNTLALAIESGMPSDKLDDICDLTLNARFSASIQREALLAA